MIGFWFLCYRPWRFFKVIVIFLSFFSYGLSTGVIDLKWIWRTDLNPLRELSTFTQVNWECKLHPRKVHIRYCICRFPLILKEFSMSTWTLEVTYSTWFDFVGFFVCSNWGFTINDGNYFCTYLSVKSGTILVETILVSKVCLLGHSELEPTYHLREPLENRGSVLSRNGLGNLVLEVHTSSPSH